MTRCSVGRATQKYRGNATGTGTSQWITTGDDISYSLGDVGIGTTSPDANLHVTGNAFVSTDLALGGTLTMGNVLVEALHELSAITATGNVTPHVIEFTNPTTGLVTTGNVGIGTSTPEYTLDVAGGINFTGALTQNGTSWRSSPWVISGSDISYTTGRIGVGTSTPEATLHVEGSVYASSNLNVGGTATGSAASGVEQQQKIQASDAQAYDSFGYSVSLSPDGNTALIGAHYEDAGATNTGAAYVFTRSNGTWSQQQKIQASDAQASDYFGYSVSLSSDGNTALVGAYGEDTGGPQTGAAYVFTRSNGTWTQQQKIQASDAEFDDRFGHSVSLSSDGNTALIGAHYEDTGASGAGAAYIFTSTGGPGSDSVLCVDTTINRVGVGTTSPSVELHVSGTGAIIVPSGTTAERPGTLVTGMIRYNTTSLKYEGYGLYSWLDLSIADVVTELYPFTSHTFTPCNGDSRYGPQLSDALSTYGNISPWDNTNFFNIVTRGFQLWTVPKTGTYRITARGARGGEASSSYAPYITTPGSGGSVRADIALTINTQVVFIVGQTPPESTGDFRSGSGGGATWVLKPGAYTDNDDVYMVAGGGGGAGPRHYNSGTAGHADASSQGTLGVGGTSHWNGNGGGAGWTADGDPVGARGGVRPAGGAMGGTGTTHGGFGGGGSESGDSAGGGAGATGGRAALRYNSTGSDTARGGTSYITTNATNRSFLGTHGLTGGGNVYVEFIS